MRLSRSLSILAFALVVFCGAAFADSFNFGVDPTAGSDSPENSETFTSGSATFTAYGYSADNTPTALFFKNGTGDENGLGLDDGGADHEIGGANFIQFSFTGNVTSITVGSVQSGESWALYGSNTLGVRGTTPLKTGTTDGVVTLPGGYAFYSLAVGSSGGDVLLDSATVAEPGTPALIMSLGVVGLFAFSRRSKLAGLAS